MTEKNVGQSAVCILGIYHGTPCKKRNIFTGNDDNPACHCSMYYFSTRQTMSHKAQHQRQQFQLLVRGLWVSFQSTPHLASSDLHIQFWSYQIPQTQKSESQFLCRVFVLINVKFYPFKNLRLQNRAQQFRSHHCKFGLWGF